MPIAPAPAWTPKQDPRNLEHQVRQTGGPWEPVQWDLPVLNQGDDGSCVGYAVANVAGRPEDAERVYTIAKTLDSYPGEAYSGTSVTAGAKAAKALEIISDYQWAYSVDAFMDALQTGPVVLGLYWTPGMLRPTYGVMTVDATKRESFGHCAIAVGYEPGMGIRIQSSWGTQWAEGGRAWLPLPAFRELRTRTGEACVVTPA